MTPFQRLIGPLYADGINAPRVSVTGHDLPLSRVVSRTMHPDEGFHDHAGTVMVLSCILFCLQLETKIRFLFIFKGNRLGTIYGS